MTNLIYPFNILNKEIYPVFGNQTLGEPLYIDMSKNNPKVDKICNNQTQKEFNNYLFDIMQKNNKNWAVSCYLENRKTLLKKYAQMMKENRVYHLGLDITVPLGSILYAPLNGEVVVSEYDDNPCSYGAMVILKHNINNVVFYSLYGHLDKNFLPKVGTKIKKGKEFAKIGDFDTNGNWFYHTHIQILTEKGFNEGWIYKGYCSDKDLDDIANYCPDPTFLLRFAK